MLSEESFRKNFADDDGCKAQDLASDAADGQVEDIIDQPADGTDVDAGA